MKITLEIPDTTKAVDVFSALRGLGLVLYRRPDGTLIGHHPEHHTNENVVKIAHHKRQFGRAAPPGLIPDGGPEAA